MGLIFKIETEADRQRLAAYDEAVGIFRAEVSQAMEEAALKAPSLATTLRAAAEALRARPLPSEADADPGALHRLTLSALTVETAFSKLPALAASQQELEAAMGVGARMREIGRETTGKPEFKPLTQAVLTTVGGLKAEVAREMEGKDLSLYLAALKAPAPPKDPSRRPGGRAPGP